MARIHELAEKLAGTDQADLYRHHQGVRYNDALVQAAGRTSIEVLPFLKGRPWNNLALAWVHALRPSTIRAGGEQTTDSRLHRVSVELDNEGKILNITQEVEVAHCNGADLWRLTNHQVVGGELEDWDQGKTFYNDKGDVSYIQGPRVSVNFAGLVPAKDGEQS
jgi:hypothetical protein